MSSGHQTFTTLAKSDIELLEELKSGSQHAFEELFNRYNRLLFIHAFKLLDDKEDARDLVQDIFIKLWDDRCNLTIKANFAGYLYAMTRNRILDRISHRKVVWKFYDYIQEFDKKNNNDTDHLVRINLLQSIIEKEISFLPTKMQVIFKLSRQRHLSHREISEKLAVSEKTVKNQVNGALKILRLRLGKNLFIYFFA